MQWTNFSVKCYGIWWNWHPQLELMISLISELPEAAHFSMSFSLTLLQDREIKYLEKYFHAYVWQYFVIWFGNNIRAFFPCRFLPFATETIPVFVWFSFFLYVWCLCVCYISLFLSSFLLCFAKKKKKKKKGLWIQH